MKRNKLRKIVCNKSCKALNVTWDEFQIILDDLVANKKLTATTESDDSVSVQLSAATAGPLGEAADATTPAPPAPPFSNTAPTADESDWVHEETTIPKMVAQHLLKNGKKKLTNIEVNTKTRIKFLEVFLDKEGKQHEAR